LPLNLPDIEINGLCLGTDTQRDCHGQQRWLENFVFSYCHMTLQLQISERREVSPIDRIVRSGWASKSGSEMPWRT
jgi:hypothetical protein